jgi:amidohydrolase
MSSPLAGVDAESTERATLVRREIHRFPELGFEEERTAAVVERELDDCGIAHRRVAKTGVVGIIRGAVAGRTVGLRADMDALPIGEESGEPFASELPNRMHACGHDAHTGMLIGAARVLQAERATLAGNVVLLFQPAEEGPGGALPMIEAGVMDAEPKIEAIAMLHVDIRIDAGDISLTPGPVNAAADDFHITVRGVGGHGAAPHKAQDTIPCSAAIVLALQNIAARETDPLANIVVTVGTIAGGYRNNVIADSVTLSGTVRTTDPAVRDSIEPRIQRIIDGVAAAYGCSAELKVIYGYPPVVNDAELAVAFTEYVRATTPIVVHALAPTMGAEDFAYFAQRVPGVLIRLGVRNETSGATHSAHSSRFRLDEAAIPVGIATLVTFARGVGSGAVPLGSFARRVVASGDRQM